MLLRFKSWLNENTKQMLETILRMLGLEKCIKESSYNESEIQNLSAGYQQEINEHIKNVIKQFAEKIGSSTPIDVINQFKIRKYSILQNDDLRELIAFENKIKPSEVNQFILSQGLNLEQEFAKKAIEECKKFTTVNDKINFTNILVLSLFSSKHGNVMDDALINPIEGRGTEIFNPILPEFLKQGRLANYFKTGRFNHVMMRTIISSNHPGYAGKPDNVDRAIRSWGSQIKDEFLRNIEREIEKKSTSKNIEGEKAQFLSLSQDPNLMGKSSSTSSFSQTDSPLKTLSSKLLDRIENPAGSDADLRKQLRNYPTELPNFIMRIGGIESIIELAKNFIENLPILEKKPSMVFKEMWDEKFKNVKGEKDAKSATQDILFSWMEFNAKDLDDDRNYDKESGKEIDHPNYNITNLYERAWKSLQEITATSLNKMLAAREKQLKKKQQAEDESSES